MTGLETLVIVATYNERDNIGRLVTEILGHCPECHVLVVDDNSPDGTGDVALAMAADDERVELVSRPGKLGLGTAYLAGFRHALEHGYNRVVTMDADFSHNPAYLPDILQRAATPGVDVVVGSRYVHGGGVVGWGLYRRVLSFGANTFARTVLGLKTHDCTGAYRCYSRSVIEGFSDNPVRSHGYSALIEIMWRCQRGGYRIEEVPITFTDRELGESKVSRGEIFRGITTVLRLRFRPQARARTSSAAS
jgi:dolichol-phosphate mannosyltransferase